MNRWKSAVSILLLLVSSFVITASTLEGWLAIVRINTKSIAQYIPGKGVTYVPGAYYRNVEEGFSEGYINTHGFRDSERTYDKPDKTFRILVLGNSYTEAFQVALENSFPAILERKLNKNSRSKKFEVLNLGQSGSGTAEEYTRYLNFGARYSPDLVLLAFVTSADIRGNSKAFNTEIAYFFDLDPNGNVTLDDSRIAEYGKTYTFSKSVFQTLKQHSYLASLISEWAFKLRYQWRQQNLEKNVMAAGEKSVTHAKLPESSSMNIYLPDMSERWKDAFAITEAGIRKVRGTVEANGSQFLLVTLTNAEQVHPNVGKQMSENYGESFDFDQPERILEKFTEKEKINSLNLLPAFREYHIQTGEFLHGFGLAREGHWNEKGHRLAAEKIFEFLKEKRMVPLD